MIKYYCDNCDIKIQQVNKLKVHTSHPRDIEFHLCENCVKPITELVSNLLNKHRKSMGEKETIMQIKIEVS